MNARQAAHQQYSDMLRGLAPADFRAGMRELALHDLFYLLVYVMGRKDMDRDWLFARCREVQARPDGYLDLWARNHYKSTIITVGKTIQDVLANPELTVGIFSHTKPISKKFLQQIMREFEGNRVLQELFPDVLYAEPRKESRLWSEDNGILLKRRTNPKEATIYASGLVDGQPVGMHFSLMIYDDVVTPASVYTPEQIARTTEAWELAQNLESEHARVRMIGTRYHDLDTYGAVMERGAAVPRIYPATEDGTEHGRPVLLTEEALRRKRQNMGPYVFCCQMLQNPVADTAQGFKREWLKLYTPRPEYWAGMNRYILVDPASDGKKSDYTVMIVVGMAEDGHYYVIHGVRDRLNLTGRTELLFRLVREYKPLLVGYEKYGLQSDIEHIRYVQEQRNYRFEVMALGGAMPKNDRIRRLVPLFEQGRLLLPGNDPFVTAEGRTRDFTRLFIDDEYMRFPVCRHDDMLDCLARVVEQKLAVTAPDTVTVEDYGMGPQNYDPYSFAQDLDIFAGYEGVTW